MTVIKMYTVNCDAQTPECEGWIAQEDSASEARKVASRAGWIWLPSVGSVCPGCRKKVTG